jgi:alcohol dehydrogenase
MKQHFCRQPISTMNYREPDSFVRLEEHPAIRVCFGPGTIRQLGKEANNLKGKRALLVTDIGIMQAGHAATAQTSLGKAGLTVTTFDKVIENPTGACVDECVAMAREADIDLIVGLGGGSSIDTAKGCNFVYTNGGTMRDYWGIGKATKPMVPLIAVPTTAGTGSECQSFALISDDETHQKMACGDKKALPKVAILDPDLTVSQPPKVTACTGIDALAHVLEAAVTRDRNETSSRHARTGFLLTQANIEKVFADPQNVEARGQVLLGASHAGAAIELSMLGAAHSMANPLTARRGIVHGNAVGMCLPVVMRYNAKIPSVQKVFAGLARDAGLVNKDSGDDIGAEALFTRVDKLLGMAGFPLSLHEHGFNPQELSDLAAEAAEQWTAQFNPREVTASDLEKLYGEIYSGSACEQTGLTPCSI